jgi:hypothetical protein
MAEPEFNRGPARRPAPIIEDAMLQWASGLQTQNRQIYAGWIVEAGKHDDLDSAMEVARFPQVTIKHGSGNIVTHWAIETANVFVIAEGVQTPAEMRNTGDRYGIAYNWRTTEQGKRQSVLKCRVLLRELLMQGYYAPLTLTVKSTFTDDVLQALTAQYSVLDQVDAFRALDSKPPMHPPFYACHIPLGPGVEVTRGKQGSTKEVTPIADKIPVPITKDYIKATWIKRDWIVWIESRMEDTIAWSVAESQRIVGAHEQYRPQEEESYA